MNRKIEDLLEELEVAIREHTKNPTYEGAEKIEAARLTILNYVNELEGAQKA